MHSLPIIKDACIKALNDEELNGMSNFRSIADPQNVPEPVRGEGREGHLGRGAASARQLVRDLTSYITLHCGTGSDPERDNLLLQAGQLLGLTGI